MDEEITSAEPSDGLRASRKFMELLRALHERGYEGLRLLAGLAPSGCYWRGSIYAVRDRTRQTKTRSSGEGFGLLFEWSDAEQATLDVLAERFIVDFAEVAVAGHHTDPAYAKWYREVLDTAAPWGVIYTYADFDLPKSGVGVIGHGAILEIATPEPPAK